MGGGVSFWPDRTFTWRDHTTDLRFFSPRETCFLPPMSSTRPDSHVLVDPHDFASGFSTGEVELYTIEVAGGITAQITNLGARIVSLFVPDRTGRMGNVTLGFDSAESYRNSTERYYGATIGRYANRIGAGKLTIDGIDYELDLNDGANHLHGGVDGFHDALWTLRRLDDASVTLQYASRHLECGYPGAVLATVTFSVTRDVRLKIDYEATTNAPTIVNLTNHAYFNLAGPGSGDVGDHALQILADEYTPIDGELIPTGEVASVEGTPMDFRKPNRIGDRINKGFEQLERAGGYDHNWVLRPTSGPLRVAARVYEPTTGRTMEVLTTEPGIQFYGGNFFDGSDVGSSGQPHGYREAFALETQHFPDSPNKPAFPSTILRPGETYRSQTTYRFLT